MRRLLSALVLALIPLSVAAQSPAVSDADARAIRRVIEAQLDAFKRGDAERAFSLATTGIRSTFRTPQAFMEMVRTQYAVVYRPQHVEFEDPILYDGVVTQPVRFTDAQGSLWLGLYPMQREDGEWRTDGCYLGRLGGREI